MSCGWSTSRRPTPATPGSWKPTSSASRPGAPAARSPNTWPRLADETNLTRLAEKYDSKDIGLRDIWETLIATGRRLGEVVNLRLDCTDLYHGLPILWHDQTKVGNHNEAIRIPD